MLNMIKLWDIILNKSLYLLAVYLIGRTTQVAGPDILSIKTNG